MKALIPAAYAVNRGAIFRFLSKPCPPETLVAALDAGIAQYQLVTAERQLLDQTLAGSVKVLTEGLAHSLRNAEGGHISAHLLIPGSTFTGMTSRGRTEKPVGAWWPDQVVDMLIDSMHRGDFYIVCPDNDVTRETDNRRILWAAQDITENRPALSRWHSDYSAAFQKFLRDQ